MKQSNMRFLTRPFSLWITDQIEEILNVTKQRDMSGFYRHLYRQTMGEEKGQQEGNENANPQVSFYFSKLSLESKQK